MKVEQAFLADFFADFATPSAVESIPALNCPPAFLPEDLNDVFVLSASSNYLATALTVFVAADPLRFLDDPFLEEVALPVAASIIP